MASRKIVLTTSSFLLLLLLSCVGTVSADSSLAAKIIAQGVVTDLSLGADGELIADTVVNSADVNASLTIYKGTQAFDSNGNSVDRILITVPFSMPENIPSEAIGSGLYYNLGPSGTTFSQLIMISIVFDPEEYIGRIPVIYSYTSEDGWIALETVADWENGRATAFLSHFSIYALLWTDAAEEPAVEIPQVIDVPPSVAGEETPSDGHGFGSIYWLTGIILVSIMGVLVNSQMKE